MMNNFSTEEDDLLPSLGKYLNSGLWRDVWSLQLDAIFLHSNFANEDAGEAVLKMMKMEHDVIPRNLERHRREAVTMERLSPSPYVIDLFAYCGNTILTEFAPQDLATAIKGKQQPKTKRGRGGKKAPPRVGRNIPDELDDHSQGDIDAVLQAEAEEEQNDKLAQNLTPIERLKLALQATKGVKALHDNDIMHADLTAKQFLVSKACEKTDTSCEMRVKINDFNRCRFIPHKSGNSTTNYPDEKCTIQIPSAPGLYRSPEEYAAKNLTEKIDVFSLGHVLFELWTGNGPWDDVGGKTIRQHVQEGRLTSGLMKMLENGKGNTNDKLGSLNHDMEKLIARCYNADPRQRITADALVKELCRLIQKADTEVHTSR